MNNYIDSLNCLVDLHLHLDGAISVDNALDLAKRQNIKLDLTKKELKDKLSVNSNCSNLQEFLLKFDLSCSLLKTKIGIKHAIINLAYELKNIGVMYAEIRYAPSLLTSQDFNQEDLVISSIEALKETAIPINLILCCMRRNNFKEENLTTVKLAHKYLNRGVVAIDLAGLESKYPVDDFKEIFELANKLNVPYVIHAGEDDGPSSIINTLKYNPYRIGHGIRAYEDKELMKTLNKNKTILELCPTSNVITGIFNDIKDFPIYDFLNSDIVVTINSDDPSVEDIDTKHEYKLLNDIFNLDSQIIKKLIINSVNYSFASKQLKKDLLSKIEDNFNV